MKILLVTNILTHYRKPLFQRMADAWDIRFLFFSDGREWYLRGGALPLGDLPAKQLNGFWMGNTKITPGLVSELSRRDYDVVIKCINGKFALPTTYTIAKARKKPFVLWTGLWQHPTSRLHRVTRPLLRQIYAGSQAVVTYGKHVSRFVVQEGANADIVFEAPQAVAAERFSAPALAEEIQELRDWAGDRSLVLYVGRMEPWKGPQVLLEALVELRVRGADFRAAFVGEGSLRPALIDRASQGGLADRVRFTGAIPNHELPAVYQAADLCVVPSIDTAQFGEPWSLAVNEAMAAGTPVVTSTSVGAFRDGLIQEGRTGLVFRVGDVPHLASQLAALIDDSELRTALRDRAAEAVSRYSYEAALEGFERAINAATGNSPRSDQL